MVLLVHADCAEVNNKYHSPPSSWKDNLHHCKDKNFRPFFSILGEMLFNIFWYLCGTYILKQSFTTVSVKVVDVYLTTSQLGKYPPKCLCQENNRKTLPKSKLGPSNWSLALQLSGHQISQKFCSSISILAFLCFKLTFTVKASNKLNLTIQLYILCTCISNLQTQILWLRNLLQWEQIWGSH